MKFRIGTTFILLLGAGMILINIVLAMFWQRDMIRSRIDQVNVAMAITTDAIGAKKGNIDRFIRALATHTDAQCTLFYSAGEQPTVTQPDIILGDCGNIDKMRAMAKEAIRTGNLQTSRGNSGIHLLPFTNHFLIVSMPMGGQEAASNALAVSVSLQPLSKEMVSNQKAVFLYILINILIFTALGLVRIVKVVIRPIERLAQMSETYTDEEGFHFLAPTGDDEFRRLSTSINQMLKRIEADKNRLKTTVKSLQSANKQLKDTQQEMVRSEKLAAVGRLAAGLAHEIGNPVGIIQGYLDLIGQSDITAEEKKDYLSRADKELQRIGGLIRSLLDFSRPDRQYQRPVLVHRLLSETVEMITIRSTKEDVAVVEQFGAEEETVFADPDQLRQVFLNVLLNAFDAVVEMAREKRSIVISTDAITTEVLSTADQSNGAGRRIRILIQDSGPGIRDADLPKLFDPFFTTKEPGKGTGLGLFVSHTIIESLGGRMAISADGDVGTVVTIELPLLEI